MKKISTTFVRTSSSSSSTPKTSSPTYTYQGKSYSSEAAVKAAISNVMTETVAKPLAEKMKSGSSSSSSPVYQSSSGEPSSIKEKLSGEPTVENQVIGSVRISSVNYRQEGNELYVDVTVSNQSSKTQEVRVYLYDAQGKTIDKEPDTYWANISANTSAKIGVSSDWKYSSIDNYPQFKIELKTQGDILQDTYTINLSTGSIVDQKAATPGEAQAQPLPSVTGTVTELAAATTSSGGFIQGTKDFIDAIKTPALILGGFYLLTLFKKK